MPQSRAHSDKSTLEQIREQRLKKLKHTNEKLTIEIKRLKGGLVLVDDLKREVIQANTIVKNRLLGIPAKLAPRLAGMTEPHEIQQTLRYEIETALNELAYGFGAR